MTLARTLLAVATLAAASTGRAQVPAPHALGPYGHLRLGVYIPNSSDLEGLNNGFNIDGALGYRFHPNFAAEAGVGYYGSSTDTQSGGGVSVKGTFSDVPITLSAKAIYPAGQAELYGLFGVGIHNVELGAEVSGLGTVTAKDTAFGFHLGAGASFEVAPRLALSLDLRYLVGRATFSLAGQSTSGDIDALFVSGGLLYRF
jgi:opacity protein-like surface antigen